MKTEWLVGVGLHGGGVGRVRFVANVGPLCLNGRPVYEQAVERTDWGVRIAGVDLVEHVFAALGGLGIHSGVNVEVEGTEVPLLDGCSVTYVHALRELCARSAVDRPQKRPVRVARNWATSIGASHYEFRVAQGTTLEVTTMFDHPCLGSCTMLWDGNALAFERDIAPARTFGFLKDLDRLRAVGRAAFVPLDAVVVFTSTGVLPGCAPTDRTEPTRHKLLDLIGDLTLLGALPEGHICALRPGHTATHKAIQRAREEGVLV